MLEQIRQAIDLFPYAFIGGGLIAVTCAVLGVFVILKRVVFIGITLSEVAACGIALAMVMHWPPFVGAALLTLVAVLYVAQPFEEERVPRDAVLGIMFAASAALSILLVSKSGFGLHEIKSLLYGDLILTSKHDLVVICGALGPALAFVAVFFRPILYSSLDADAARVLGIRVRLWEAGFFVALGLAVSAASKAAGGMLVFAYLVVLPSAALMLSRRLGVVVALAIGLSVVTTGVGLVVSFAMDLPTNQTLITATVAVFLAVVVAEAVKRVVVRLRR